MRRRTYLATAGAVTATAGLAGCLDTLRRVFTAHDPADDPWSNEHEQESSSSRRLTVDFELPEDTYGLRSARPNLPVEFVYTVENDTQNRIEMLVFSREDVNDFRDSKAVFYFENLYDKGVDLEASGELPPGSYVFALINTDYGDVDPEGDVSGTLDLQVSM